VPQVDLPPSFPEYVRNMLRHEIITGRLLPDERVTEKGLEERLGVSRTPIREAIQALEREGLIVRHRARATYIAPLMSAGEARILYRMRIVLESYLAAQAASRVTDDDLEYLSEMNSEFRELAARDAPENELIELDSRFHSTIYEVADEAFLLSIVGSYWSKLIRELMKPERSHSHPVFFATAHVLFAEDHDKIVVALRQRDAAAAGQAMASHIRAAWREIVRITKATDDSRPATLDDGMARKSSSLEGRALAQSPKNALRRERKFG
jgi:DNA-binding GntR family transcriptional regulator